MWTEFISTIEKFTDTNQEDVINELIFILDSASNSLQIDNNVQASDGQLYKLPNLRKSFNDILTYLEHNIYLRPGYEFDSNSTEYAEILTSLKRLRSLLTGSCYPITLREELDKDNLYWCDSKQLKSHFDAKKAIERSASVHKDSTSASRKSDNRQLPLSHFLLDTHSLVVLGEPGAGKSWGLAKFAHEQFKKLASKIDDSAISQSHPFWIPVYASVSEVLEVDDKGTEKQNRPITSSNEQHQLHLPQFFINALKRQKTLEWLFNEPQKALWLARVGAFFCIFDSLNQIPLELRQTFAKDLSEFRTLFPHTRVILASRTKHWDPEGFEYFDTIVTVQPLNDKQVAHFIRECFSGEDAIYATWLQNLLGLLGENVESGSKSLIYKITNRTLEKLETQEVVPDDVVKILHGLKGQEISGEENFLKELRTKIGENNTDNYKSSILKHSQKVHTIAELRTNPYFLDKIIRIYQARLKETNKYKSEDIKVKTREAMPVNRGDLFRGYIELEAINKDRFPLQHWMLSVLGLHMTYAEITDCPLHEAENVLFVAFCTAPMGYLVDPNPNPLFKKEVVKGEARKRNPEGILKEIRKVKETFLWESSKTRKKPLFKRFNCKEELVVRKFRELLKTIAINAFLEKVGNEYSFSHQSLQEYYAAEHFVVLYKDIIDSFEKSLKTVPEFLRFRRYDDMLHIVIGCVFHDQQETISKILKYLLEVGSRFRDVRDALEFAEYIDDSAKKMLLKLVLHFIKNVNAPDELRAAAIDSIQYLDIDSKEVHDLLANPLLLDGPETWKALLELNFQLCDTTIEIFDNKVFTAIISRAEAAGDDALRRRSELLIATSEWVNAHKGIALRTQLINEIILGLGKNYPNLQLSGPVKDTLLKGDIFPLSSHQWKDLLANIVDPHLYTEILEYQHNDRNDFLRKVFSNEQIIINEIERLGEKSDGWDQSFIALIKIQQILKLNPIPILRSVIKICEIKENYPKLLSEFLWNMNLTTLCKVDFDKNYLNWFMKQPIDKRPAGFSTLIKNAVYRTRSNKTIAKFAYNLELISSLAVTLDAKVADDLTNVISRLIEKLPVDFASPFLRMYSFRRIRLLKELNKNVVTGQNQNTAVLILLRMHRDKLNDNDLIKYLSEDVESRILNVVYIGASTDRFVRERPDLLKKISYKQEKVISILNSHNSAYSTRIVVYRHMYCLGYGYLVSHPLHPFPSLKSPSYASFCRLLKYNLIDEASYQLTNNENPWNPVRNYIKSNAPELLSAAEKAKSHADNASWSTASTPERPKPDYGITDNELLSEQGINKMIKHPEALLSHQIILLRNALLNTFYEKLHMPILELLEMTETWEE